MKRKKALKRLDTNHESKDNASSTSESHLKSNTEVETDSTQTKTDDTDADKSNIWKEKPTEDMEKTREKEFEEYLADLLM